MNRITEFFVKRPVLFWSLVAGIIIAGIYSFVKMPKLEDPAVSVKQAMVIVPYPGAEPYQVEMDVAQMMEDQLRTLPDVQRIKSECRDGMALITVEFKMSVMLDELEQHFDLLRRKVSDISPRLPQGCYDPIVMDDMMDVYGMFFALTSESMSYPDMYRYARYIRRELLGVEGVKRITIAGNRDEVINIIVPKESIARNGMIPTQIMMALQPGSKTVDAGAYASGGDVIPLRVGGGIKDEKDIENLLVSTVEGTNMRLGDIATVRRTFSEPQRNGFFVDGKPALAICIAMEEDAIVPDVGKAVDAKLAGIMDDVPAGLEMEKIFFQPDKVSSAISSFMLNLLESVLIVILVLIFTMGFRSGLIIGFGLVLTVAVSFPILLVSGTTLQRISLGAFIVAMGMLVDNAIVIMDGILLDKKRGLGPKTFLYRIGKNTAMPLLGATLIAVSTFLNIYLSPDSAGEYAGDLFLVLCVSLLASWVLALVQVPVCAKAWLPLRGGKYGKSSEKVLDSPVHRFVRRVVTSLIAHKKVTISVAVVVLLVSVAGILKTKILFFPDFDYEQFVVEYFLPGETGPDRVREDLVGISEKLMRSPEVEKVAVSVGSAPARYCLVRPMTSGGDCYGELIVNCKDYKTVQHIIPDLRKRLREEYPDAYIRIRKYNFSISTSHTVEVEFSGPDPAVLKSLAAQAEDIMRACPYVDTYSVQNNWKNPGKTFIAEYSKEDALRSGITRSDIGNALLASSEGMPVGVLHDQDRMVTVNLQVRNGDGSIISDMSDIPVWSTLNVNLSEDDLQSALSGGNAARYMKDRVFASAPLSSVTDGIRLGWEEQAVYRVDGQRAIEAECDPDPDNDKATPFKVMREIKDEIEAIPLPDGYSIRWLGENDLFSQALTNVLKFVPLTLFIILVILLLLFNSWKKLILIILCLPFVFCGITPSLILSGTPFTFMGIIGLMGLIGMMVKNAIVLVDEITRLNKEEKQPLYHAVVNATVSRVRPVLMASLTTIVGMIPLLGDPMYGSMAVTIMGGLTVGTVITLMLLPLFYTALFGVKIPETGSEKLLENKN